MSKYEWITTGLAGTLGGALGVLIGAGVYYIAADAIEARRSEPAVAVEAQAESLTNTYYVAYFRTATNGTTTKSLFVWTTNDLETVDGIRATANGLRAAEGCQRVTLMNWRRLGE